MSGHPLSSWGLARGGGGCGRGGGFTLRCPLASTRSFDLVRPKEDRFRVPFYYALRDTLVAPDMDVAAATGELVWAASGDSQFG